MNEKPTIEVGKVPVITKFIYTLGVLPTSYLMSMTYEEQLVWLCNYIQTTLIPQINEDVEAIQELQNLYELLRKYVNDYFDNLDVQEEINNKLDKMLKDGSLTNLIKNYLDPIVSQQNTRITSVENELRSVANGSPLVASSTSDMTDTTRTYVNTTDGKWYYYDGDSWEIGGTYQSSGISENEIQSFMLESNLQDMLFYSYTPLTGTTYTNTIMQKTGNTTSWNNAQYTVYNVSPNDILFITSKWTETQYNVCINLLYNSAYVSYVSNVSNPVLYKLIIPEGVNKIALNNMFLGSSQVLKVNGYSDRSTKEFITKMSNNLTEEYDTINLSNVATITDTFYRINTETNVIGTDYNANSKGYAIPVIENEKYKITAFAGGNAVEYAIVDKDYNVLDYEKDATFSQREFSLTMPAGACWVVFNDTSGTNKAVVKKLKELELSNIDYIYTQEILMQKVSYEEESRYEQLKNDWTWKVPQKLYLSFVFDDSTTDTDLIEDLFEEENVPCCFATIPNKLNSTTTNGETIQQVLQRCEENGGEVLSHWGSPLTSSSSEQDYIDVYYGAKKTLVNAGFTVNGIITAGGTNYQTQDFVKDIELARPYYRFGDSTAYIVPSGYRRPMQYYNLRLFINSDNTVNFPYIDSFSTNGKVYYQNDPSTGVIYGKDHWLILASHGANDSVSINTLRSLIQYIKAKGNIEIVSMTEAFNSGSSSLLEQRIENLE